MSDTLCDLYELEGVDIVMLPVKQAKTKRVFAPLIQEFLEFSNYGKCYLSAR